MQEKKWKKHKVAIALNLSYVKKEKINPDYVLTYNSNCKKQVILLMISNEKKICLYFVVKKLPPLFREITSKNNSGFYCLKCLHFFRTNKKPESHKRVIKIKIFVM